MMAPSRLKNLGVFFGGVVSEKPFHIYRFYGEKKKKRVPEENGQKEKERESEKKIKKRRAAADNLMSEAFWENV